ncbi:MAG: hypothetical protein IPQ18_08870 [Saprospiraceae bacterium]|nr:hypothetical protein [Saprospiraceae bacterium]
MGEQDFALSMRLVNADSVPKLSFFGMRRALTLEDQTTKPIQDHSEMGFSGQNGDPSINDPIANLAK